MASFRHDLADLARSFSLDAIYAFGSRATELAGHRGGPLAAPTPDVDIGVQPREGTRPSARDRVRLTGTLEDLLAVNRVDLVVLDEVDPFLALDIVRGELLYCADPDRQAEQELYVLRRAGDLARYERERRRAILGTGP